MLFVRCVEMFLDPFYHKSIPLLVFMLFREYRAPFLNFVRCFLYWRIAITDAEGCWTSFVITCYSPKYMKQLMCGVPFGNQLKRGNRKYRWRFLMVLMGKSTTNEGFPIAMFDYPHEMGNEPLGIMAMH